MKKGPVTSQWQLERDVCIGSRRSILLPQFGDLWSEQSQPAVAPLPKSVQQEELQGWDISGCGFFPVRIWAHPQAGSRGWWGRERGWCHCWRQELCGDKLRDNFPWAQGGSSSAGEPGPCACSLQGHMPKSPGKKSISPIFSWPLVGIGSISHFPPCATRTFPAGQSRCLAVAKPHHSVPGVPRPAS